MVWRKLSQTEGESVKLDCPRWLIAAFNPRTCNANIISLFFILTMTMETFWKWQNWLLCKVIVFISMYFVKIVHQVFDSLIRRRQWSQDLKPHNPINIPSPTNWVKQLFHLNDYCGELKCHCEEDGEKHLRKQIRTALLFTVGKKSHLFCQLQGEKRVKQCLKLYSELAFFEKQLKKIA